MRIFTAGVMRLAVCRMIGLKHKVVSSVFWRMSERLGTHGVSFVVSIVLARILGPEVYGTVALLTIFIAISGILIDSGFGAALVQKEIVSDVDLNSAFYVNLIIGLLAYGVLFFVAPLISRFYHKEILIPLLRLLSIVLIFNALNVVQSSVLMRGLLFKLSFIVSIAQIIVSGVVGIVLALTGRGIWALVWSQLSGVAVATVLRWCVVGWRPGLSCSSGAIRELYYFGWKLLCASLLNNLYINMSGLIIGRLYMPAELAFFNRGQQIPKLIMETVNSTIGTVAFPVLSRLQNDKLRLLGVVRKMIFHSTFWVLPAMTGLAFCAPALIELLLGDKWLRCVPFIQLYCIVFALWPFHTVNLQAISALGRSDIFLKLEIIKKSIGVIVLILVCRHGALSIAMSSALVTAPIGLMLNGWPLRRLLGYGIFNQIADALPNLLLCLAVALPVFLISFVSITGAGPRLLVQILAGTACFIAMAVLTNNKAVPFYRDLAKDYFLQLKECRK